MKKLLIHIFLLSSLAFISCSGSRKNAIDKKDNGKIEIVFVQVNDVYEIAPLEDGKVGGMAKVATLKKQYAVKNPNTFLLMAGDFLSPSVYNSLKYEGKRIRGKQMVEAMNVAGMDMAIFGNHEFDISESELQDRINESKFKWVASNSFHKKGTVVTAFVKTNSEGTSKLPENVIMAITDADGTTANIGFIGLTLPFNKASYVDYADPFFMADTLYNRMKDICDAVIAITHQSMEDDIALAKRLPGLAAIIGGHEHDMRFQKVGEVYITKAHANARSAYIVKLQINKRKQQLKVKPKLQMIDASIALDPATDAVVQKWTDIANKNYASLGFDATKVVMQNGVPLDGRETQVRSETTNFTKMIVNGMQAAAPLADIAIVNAGAIRVDDMLQAPVTQYDIIRSLPFGGGITEVDMKGSLLIKVLTTGMKNKGIGGFLHYNSDVVYNTDAKQWFLKGQAIDATKNYHVAMLDFLITGGEANMDYLTPKNPDVVKMYPVITDATDPRSDVRLAIIRHMEKL